MNPPLPEKQAIGPHRNHVYAYTEDQLLAYRVEVIEMCAKLVEKDPMRKAWALAQDLRGLI